MNAIRKENPALQSNERLEFHKVDNDQIICYSKRTADNKNLILTIINLDPRWSQSGFVELPLKDLGIDVRHPYRMVDLLTGTKFVWQGSRNYVELRPHEVPAHILRREEPQRPARTAIKDLPETKRRMTSNILNARSSFYA